MSTSEKEQDASIVWFEIPADNPERVKAFYSNLFGWKINPFPGTSDFSSFMLQAQASKADVVAIANGGDDAINAVKTAREFGITDKQKVVPSDAQFG